MNIPIIRLIEKKDNPYIAALIRKVLEEMEAPKIGTAYADPNLDSLFETYQNERSAYFVLEFEGKLWGGAGIVALSDFPGNVCELQKMYFLPQARGKGHGMQMMEFCIAKAREFAYDSIYLETMTNMLLAQTLYKKAGFRLLDGPLGNTGHYSCPVHMLKTL